MIKISKKHSEAAQQLKGAGKMPWAIVDDKGRVLDIQPSRARADEAASGHFVVKFDELDKIKLPSAPRSGPPAKKSARARQEDVEMDEDDDLEDEDEEEDEEEAPSPPRRASAKKAAARKAALDKLSEEEREALLDEIVSRPAEPVHRAQPRMSTTARRPTRAPAPEGTVSKRRQAEDMYIESDDKSRRAMIQMFKDRLGMSPAMASTYFYNIKKAVAEREDDEGEEQ